MGRPIVQQLLLTRFNVRSYEAGYTEAPPRPWLEARFALFARYCAPSVAAQTEEDFEWIVFCDDGTAPDDLERIRGFDRRIRIVLFAPAPPAPPEGERPTASPAPRPADREAGAVLSTLRVYPHVRPGVDIVLATRLDNDDALSRHALRRVRDHVARFLETGHPQWVYNPTLGYRLDHATGRLSLASHRSGPFLTMFERVVPGVRPIGPYAGNHVRMHERYPTYQDAGARLWLAVAHGGNVVKTAGRGRVRGGIAPSALGDDFAVSLPTVTPVTAVAGAPAAPSVPTAVPAAPSATLGADPLAARLGGTRASFEAAYGAAPYEVPGFGRVGVVYREDRVVRVNLAADRPRGKPQHEPNAADWTPEVAHEVARRFLPADAVAREPVREGRVTPCRSAALARVMGVPGACRYAFRPTPDGRVAAISVAVVDRHADRDAGETPREAPEERPVVVEAAGPVVAFGGDVNLGLWLNPLTAEHGPARALAGVPELAAADLAVVNLESVVAAEGAPVDKGEQPAHFFRFRGRPETLAVLTAARIGVVATANNHAGDYGPAALLEQARLLDGMGLGHPGSGPDREAACAPVVRRAGNLAVAVFSADATTPRFAATADEPGTCHLPWNDVAGWRACFAPRIAAARASADVVLVAVHAGPDFEERPRPQAVAIGRALIEAGADAVLGTSAHVLQGVEVYRGRPILHDAGNLLWPARLRPEAAVFSLILAPEGVRQVWVSPVEVDAGISRSVGGERGRAILATLAARSAAFGTTLVVQGDRGVIDLPPLPPREPPPEIAPPNRPAGSPPQPLAAPPPECVASAVPDAARIAPLAIGPLTLLGVAIAPPSLSEPTLLWFDTYWTANAPVATDLWVAVTGRPLRPEARVWRHDHEPCDWRWPTSRWIPGTIYRDRFALRPPRAAVASPLEIWIGLRSWEGEVGTDRAVAHLPLSNGR